MGGEILNRFNLVRESQAQKFTKMKKFEFISGLCWIERKEYMGMGQPHSIN